MASLKVPYACDDEKRLVTPAEAVRGGGYCCPGCGDPLILRQGDQKVAHFAHRATQTCSQETIIHRTAKALIQQVVRERKGRRGQTPRIRRSCSGRYCSGTVDQPLPERIDEAQLEVRLSCGSVADVALLANGKVIAAVEILVTHAVDEEKRTALSVPYLELPGAVVLDNPLDWATENHTLRPEHCRDCLQAYARFHRRVDRIAKSTGMELPTECFRYAPFRCWGCKQEMLVFTWPGNGGYATDLPRNVPRPRTFRFVKTEKAIHAYWLNTCPHCNAPQGDTYVFSRDFSPFYNFHSVATLDSDSPQLFRQDVFELALHYARRW